MTATNSVKDYYDKVVKPNIKPEKGTYQHAVTWDPIYGNMPTIDWNSGGMLDRITYGYGGCGDYYGNYTASCSSTVSDSNSLSVPQWIMLGVSGVQTLFSLCASVMGIVDSFKGNNSTDNGFSGKENKEIDQAVTDVQSVDVALSGSIETAQSLIDNNIVDLDTLDNAARNLTESKGLAEKQRNVAQQNKSSAEKAKKDNEKHKISAENAINRLNTEIAGLEADINKLKLDLNDATDDARKDKIEADIKKKEEKLKVAKKELEKQQKLFDQAVRTIEIKEEIIRQNQANITTLNANITTATHLIEQLNQKIERDSSQ